MKRICRVFRLFDHLMVVESLSASLKSLKTWPNMWDGAHCWPLAWMMALVERFHSHWRGDVFTRGIYDLHIIELKQIPLLEQSPADVMVRYAVKDIMASEVQRCAPPNSTKNAERIAGMLPFFNFVGILHILLWPLWHVFSCVAWCLHCLSPV